MILLALIAAFVVGVAITYWIALPLLDLFWRRHDRKVLLARAADHERRADALLRRYR